VFALFPPLHMPHGRIEHYTRHLFVHCEKVGDDIST
jgi:hypothetical protein